MANNQTDKAKDEIKRGIMGNHQQSVQQKKGFEQGNGNNSTTADPKKGNENQIVNEETKQDQGNLNSKQGEKTSNNEQSIKKNGQDQDEINDDEDVDEKSDGSGSYKNKSRVDLSAPGAEKKGKKIPTMSSSISKEED